MSDGSDSGETRRAEVRGDGDSMSPFIPMTILGLVVAAWFGFQAMQLRVEREAMIELLMSQEKQLQQAKKLRDSLDILARSTAQLADAGNPNARLILEGLKKRGITLSASPGQTGTNPTEPPR